MKDIDRILQATSHYTVLNVSRSASALAVKTAHRRLATLFHPDRCADPRAADVMARVNVAYTCLIDKESRRVYDELDRSPANASACPRCGGKGTVMKRRGFTAGRREICDLCGGSGC